MVIGPKAIGWPERGEGTAILIAPTSGNSDVREPLLELN